MDLKKIELLAPAGSPTALKMAIINGANAVYLGLESFNARENAENFSLCSLKEAVCFASLYGTKVYLTINTLLKDSELDDAVKMAKSAWENGVSAIIVQDIGFVKKLKSLYPEIVLHASTQMGIHNLYGAKSAKDLGLDRIILSRETPLDEIKRISDNCSIELECFVHGALCCGFSGNCYFSSIVSGKSGNRGRCLQLCRKPYLLLDCSKSDRGYWLSTRDTMLIRHLKRLSDAGICSFKIEGRARRIEYAGEVTKIYRKAIDGLIINDKDIDNLKLMFNRGNFSSAHMDGADSNIIYPFLQSHMGLRLGSVKDVYKNRAVLDCLVNKGDGIKFLRDNREVGHALVLRDGNETGFVGKIECGDGVYLTDSAKKNEEINSRIKKIPIKINASFSVSNKSVDIAINNSFKSSYFVDIQKALNAPISYNDIRECLTSLGSTYFECELFEMQLDEEFFSPKSVLKGLKRRFISDYEIYLINSFNENRQKGSKSQDIFSKIKPFVCQDNCTIIMCGKEDIKLYENYADYIAVKPDNYSLLLDDIKKGKFIYNKRYILDLPAVSFTDDLSLLQEIIDSNVFDKFIVNNIYGLSFVDGEILLGYKMNMLNSFIDFPKLESIEGVYSKSNNFVYTFGCPDLMQTVHCYYKKKRGCNKCDNNEPITLLDDKKESYKIVRQKIKNCYNLIVPYLPMSITETDIKKRFIDATNLLKQEKEYLLSYLNNEKQKTIRTLVKKNLD